MATTNIWGCAASSCKTSAKVWNVHGPNTVPPKMILTEASWRPLLTEKFSLQSVEWLI